MSAAVNGHAAASHGQFIAPRLGAVERRRRWITKEGAGSDDLANGASLNQFLHLAHIGPVLGLFGHHKDGAGLLGRG